MQYNEMKKKMFIDVENIVTGTEITHVTNLRGYVMRKYGIGDKLLENVLKQLENEEKIEISGEIIKNLKVKK